MQSQTDKLYNLLSDGRPHRTDEILKTVYGDEHKGLARVGARKSDVQEKYGVKIKGWKDEHVPSLYWYQMEIEKDWRKELVKECLKGNSKLKTAEEVLEHISCRTGIVNYKKPEDITQEKAKWLLSEFQFNQPCCLV